MEHASSQPNVLLFKEKKTFTRVQEHVLKTTAYTGVVYNEFGTGVICTANDKSVRQVIEGSVVNQFSTGTDSVISVCNNLPHCS